MLVLGPLAEGKAASERLASPAMRAAGSVFIALVVCVCVCVCACVRARALVCVSACVCVFE